MSQPYTDVSARNSPTPQLRPWLTKFGVPNWHAKRQLDQSPGLLWVPPSVASASGPFPVADVGQLGRDLVERLLPADLLPLVRAALADPLEREVEAVGVLVQLDARRALDAELALRDRVVAVAVEADGPAVLDLDEHPAVLGAEGAERPLHIAAKREFHRCSPSWGSGRLPGALEWNSKGL